MDNLEWGPRSAGIKESKCDSVDLGFRGETSKRQGRPDGGHNSAFFHAMGSKDGGVYKIWVGEFCFKKHEEFWNLSF